MSDNQIQKVNVSSAIDDNDRIHHEEEDLVVDSTRDQEMDEHVGDNCSVLNIEESHHDKSCNNNNNEEEDVALEDDVDHDIYYEYDDQDNDCHIQRAIRKDESIDEILETLNYYPLEVQHQNKLGYYPLHTACSDRGLDKVAMMLIELFPKAAQCRTLEGHYPLHLAIRHYTSADVAMKLMEVFPEAVIESTATGKTPLLCLAFNRNPSKRVITKLIEINPLVLQEKNDNDEYPIHRAIIERQPIAIIKILLDGDPLGIQRRSGVSSGDGSTPLHLACKLYNADLVQYLLQRSDLQINVRDSSGKTALHHACNHHREQIVEMILHHTHVDVNAIDWCYGDTPLHITLRTEVRMRSGICSISYSPPEKIVDMMQQLLNHPFILINEKNRNDNQTPLDMIQARLNELKDRNNNNLISTEEVQYQCYLKMIHLLKEFLIKQRYQSYCYHFNMFKDL